MSLLITVHKVGQLFVKNLVFFVNVLFYLQYFLQVSALNILPNKCYLIWSIHSGHFSTIHVPVSVWLISRYDHFLSYFCRVNNLVAIANVQACCWVLPSTPHLSLTSFLSGFMAMALVSQMILCIVKCNLEVLVNYVLWGSAVRLWYYFLRIAKKIGFLGFPSSKCQITVPYW